MKNKIKNIILIVVIIIIILFLDLIFFNKKEKNIVNNSDVIENVLKDGAIKASNIAYKTLAKVERKIGLEIR